MQRSVLEKSEQKEKSVTCVFLDIQTEKEKLPEVYEKERKTYADIVRKYVE